MATKANFSYEDKEIVVNGLLRYLRIKRGLRHDNQQVLTIRTKKNGKGVKIASVKGTIYSEEAYIKLLHKLHRKVKFKFLQLIEIPKIPEEEKDK